MKAPESALEQELKKDPAILDRLLLHAVRRTVNEADAKDVRAITLYRAFMRERAGKGWQPGTFPLLVHLLVIQKSVLIERARRGKRKPQSPLEDAPEQHDEAPLAEHAYMTIEDKLRAMTQLREALAAESQGAEPIAILDGWSEGIEEHAKLAERIKGTVPQVRAAIKRLERCAARIAGTWS